MCKTAGGSCTNANDCCNFDCVNGTCGSAQCISDGQACTAGSTPCCSGPSACQSGTCAQLGVGCHTAGNACSSNADCCSGTCDTTTMTCAAPSTISFCGQTNDICFKDADCCTGVCGAAGSTGAGTCQAIPSSTCTVDGLKCNGCSTSPACCSSYCGAYGNSGATICQPAGGCRILGDLCRQNSDCCGGDQTACTLEGAGDVVCNIFDTKRGLGTCGAPSGTNCPSPAVCTNASEPGCSNSACIPEGDVCHCTQYDPATGICVQNGGTPLPSGCSVNSVNSDCCGATGASKMACRLDKVGVPALLHGHDVRSVERRVRDVGRLLQRQRLRARRQRPLRLRHDAPACPTGGKCSATSDCCPGERQRLHHPARPDHGRLRQSDARRRADGGTPSQCSYAGQNCSTTQACCAGEGTCTNSSGSCLHDRDRLHLLLHPHPVAVRTGSRRWFRSSSLRNQRPGQFSTNWERRPRRGTLSYSTIRGIPYEGHDERRRGGCAGAARAVRGPHVSLGATRNEVTRAQPGTAWRVAGGLAGAPTATPTVAGVAVPSWFGQRGAAIRRIAGRVTFAGQPVEGATVELASAITDAGLLPKPKRRTAADGKFDFGSQPPATFTIAAIADGHSPAIVELDARNPQIATDAIELQLGGCESSLFGHVNDASGGPIAAAQVCIVGSAGFMPTRPVACSTADASGAYSICITPHQDTVGVSAPGYGAIYDHVEYRGRRMQRDYALSPEATVVGRVVRADTNAPVAGASVRVTSIDQMFQRFAAPGAAVSDAQGKFTIGGLAAGRQRVVAFAEGLTSIEAIDINVEAGKPTGEIVLRLRPAARIAGVVTDGRDPIVGASVSLGTAGMGFDAVTQADGSFVIDPVARGRNTVWVRDYDVKEPKTINIDRASMTDVRVIVASLGSVAGRVTMGGKPLAGARVNCGRTETAFADANGNYIVRGLTADKYHVFADSPEQGAFGEAQDFTLKKGEQKTGVDVEIKYSASIAGVVVDTDGKPVGNVMVNYDAPKIQDSGQDVTAPDGSFRAAFMKGGAEYTPMVHVGARNFSKVKVVSGDEPVDVKDGSTAVTGVRIVVQRDHLSIAGTTVDGDGQPLGDVHINAFRTDGDNSAVFNLWVDHPSTTSSGDGRFAIDDLDAGSFVLQARGGDGSEAIVRGIAAGQKTVVIKLARAGGIDGTLVDFASPPSVHAQRQLPGAFMPGVFATVEGNAFHFRGLNPGTYQVAASGSDSDAAMVEVSAGQIATVTLKSRGSARIRGRVVEWSSGAPVGGFQCITGLRTSPAMPMWIGGAGVISDDSGAFEIDDAPAGAIAVHCMGTGDVLLERPLRADRRGGPGRAVRRARRQDRPDVPWGSIGAQIQPGPMPARFMNVTPQGRRRSRRHPTGRHPLDGRRRQRHQADADGRADRPPPPRHRLDRRTSRSPAAIKP